jgi:hypothetical protein
MAVAPNVQQWVMYRHGFELQSVCNQEQGVRVIALQPEQPGLQRGRLS